ncbi:glycoside hydrolase family 66 protein [Micromonospora sp. MS34]|uniref:glycoside hydrolase family 66 protein n=1 Tax=Micromonospora sp. MS34 TaxID=3385971 RepID=UPI0039A0BCB3
MLLPDKATYTPGETIRVELPPAPAPRRLAVEHLGRLAAEVDVAAGQSEAELPALAEGGYSLTLTGHGDDLHSAVEVLANPTERLRYGFVASYAPDRDVEPVARLFRRLHLSACQFYDWAYRHANLVGPAVYRDPLGQPVSLDTVIRMAARLRATGTAPLGYAAVYAVGHDEWPAWEHAALLQPDGQPYSLADFLRIVDPADPGWLAHFTADLREAADAAGFAGFHLDQYGFPRRAVRHDGTRVNVAAAFGTLLAAVRNALPDATLIFNNVNDFPAWATTTAPQDVTYTEPWQPHDDLADLAAIATRARLLAPRRPAVLAAYQTAYDKLPAAAAETTNRLTMATLFSHGATQLLAGEAGNVLVDPYYVRNHTAEPSTLDLLARWYDLLVAAGDILLAPGLADITRSVTGTLNDEIDVHADVVPIRHDAVPGAVWRRVVDTPHGQAVHLINLTGQAEAGWDTAKEPLPPVTGLSLRIRRTGDSLPIVRVADPDRGPTFTTVDVSADGNHATAALPPLHAWQIVLISDQ